MQKLARVLPLTSEQGSPAAAETASDLAEMTGFNADKGIAVVFEDGSEAFAQTTLPLNHASMQEAIAKRQRVLVVTTRSGERIITGLLQPFGGATAGSGDEVNVRVDSDRLVLTGRKEVELRCGSASLVLREDGEVIVRGTSIVSRSRGKNVISGGTIRLN